MATFDDISKQRREAKNKHELSTGNSSTVFDDIASRRRAYRNKLNEEEQKKNKEENRLRINKWFNDAQNAIETADLYMSDNSYGAMMNREKNINSVLDEINAHSGFVKAYIKKREGTENGEKLSNLFNNYKNTIDSYKEKASEDTNIAKYSLNSEQVKRLLNPADSFKLIKESDFSNNEKVELLKPVDGWLSNNLYSAEELDKNQKQKEYDDYINRVEKEESIQQYAEKYKNSKLEQRKNAMIHSSDPLELDWLNKHLYENSSSEELKLEQEKLRDNFSNYNQEYNRVVDEASSINKKQGFDYDGELKKMETERNNFSAKINELDGLIERRIQEENEDKYYNDIISDNAKAGTIVQQYYNIVNGITSNNNVVDSYSEMQGIVENDEERKNRISAEFEKLKEQGIDADKMLKYYSRIHEREERAKFLDRVAGNSKKDPVFSSLGSVVDNTVGSVWDAGRYVGAWADKTFLGGDGYIDPNSTNVKKARVVREAVSEDMNGFGKFLYQTGMSMADFTAMLPMNLFPGGQAASLAILSSSAGVDSANTVLENGGTLDKAILSGIASGTAEAFFERFSLEQLKAFKQSGGSEVKDLVLNVLKGSFTEGSEEVATEISNAITDQIINGDMSSLSLQYQNYIDSGMTEDEANKQIAIDFGSQVGLSFAGGALSGGVLNIGVGGINYINNKVNENKATSAVGSLLNGQGADENTSADELITLGKDLDSTSKAHKLATKIETDTANGNKVSDKKMGKLFNAVMRDTSTYTERTYKQETKNLNKQETAVVDKIIKGKSLNKAEVKISQNDNVASAVKSIIKSRSKAHSTQKSAVDTVNNAIRKTMGVISDDNTSDIDVKVSKSHGFVINDKPYSGVLNIVDTDPKTRTVVYETENGDIVTSDNIEFPTHEEGAINYLASRYNANTAQKFVNDYKQGQNIEKYAREWNLYQNYGRLVVPLTQENMNNRTILTDEQMYSAYDSGIESYKSHYQTQKILAQKAKQSSNYSFKHGSFDDSAVRNLHLNKEQRSTLKGIKAFAELTGLNIEMFASKSDNNGDYIGEQGSWNAETKTLRLDINSGKRSVNNANINHAITNTMAHELTHTAAEGKYFGELRDTLAKIINDSEIAEATFKDLVDNQLNNIEKNNKYKSLTEDEKLNLAEEEAVAEACEIMLKNTSIFDTLISENKNLAQRILDSLKAFIKHLQEFINKNTSALTYEGSILEQALNASKEAYAKLQDVWDKAVISGIKTINAKTEQKNNTADNSNVKNSSRYSYDKLINKPDMKITVIDDSIEYTPNASTRKSIVDDAVKNAAKVGYINTNGNVAVNVKDIDTDIIISKKALRHGIDRRLNVLAPITLNVGEILHNSIKINEMTPKNSNVDKSYILIGTAKNKVNEPYIVTFVVNRSTNELTSVDVLYSINTKTEPVGSLSPDVPTKVDYLTGSKISISNLLDYVNKYYADILPEDVLKYYNYDTRPEGKLGKSVLYQFGGRKAEGADVSLLDKAERMEKDGSDSETIRQETDWFRGYDGKWRFEIDDSKMTFIGLSESDIDRIAQTEIFKNRMNELEKKVVNDTATRAEENEYYELDDQLIETQHSGTLDDYITHPTLFKAYPQLKSIKVNFTFDILENANYNSSTNTITLNARLRNAELKNTLAHEIQHAIQNIENFARGSTIEHWENSNSDNPYGDYYKTAGEIEARDVEKRIDYNTEQRKNIRPDIDREDAVFADSEVSYSTKKSFNEQVDDALEGKLNKRNALFVSKTSDVLLGIGMKQLPMLYTQSHLNNAIKPKTINNTRAHGLTVEQVKYMPKIIKHPAIIMDSLSSNEDVVLISDKLDNDGAPIILIVHPNGKGVYELITQPSNFIKSYYGKNNDFKGYIERAISTEKILYINKDKSQSLYQQIRLQLPNGFNKLGFDKIIQQSNNIVNYNSIQKNLDNPDIRYQSRNSNNDYSKALNKEEWASFYSSLQKDNQRNAFRIGDNGILIPDKNTSENYKLVCYECDSNNAYITAVYKLKNYDYNIHDGKFNIAETIIKITEANLDDKYRRTILQNYYSMSGTLLERYNRKSGRFVKLTRESVSNRENVGVEPDRTGAFDDAGQGVSNGRLDEDIKFQQRSDGGFSNRELLSNALDNVVQNGEEKSVLKAYKEGISQINELEERLKTVNSQIRDISFAKGADRSQLPKLKEQQKQLRQRIDRKDSLLLKIEAMKPMQSLIANAKTKAIQKYRAKANEQIAKIRESKNAKIAKEIKHRQEAVQKIRDNRNKKEYINKINKLLKDIDKLINRSKSDRTVKQDLRNPATKMISTSMALFDDTISNADIVRRGVTYATPQEQELLKKYLGIVGQTYTELSDADKRKIYQLNSDLKELFKREREIINRTTVKNALTELCDAYKSIKSSSESYIRDSFDENIVEAIDNFKEEVGGTVVKDMSLSQIKEYHKIVTMMLTTIRRANKLFSKNMKATCEQTATDVMNEIQNIRKTKESHNIILKWVSEFNWNNLKPIYAFRFIGSKTFENIFWNVQRGEIKWYIDLSEAKSFKENCESKYNYKSFDFKKKFEFESADGNKFNLDLNQMMDIYAASRRPQALQHLLKGGFTFEKNSPDGKLKVKTGAKAYPLTMETIQSIANELSENEKGYAEEMQKYLSEVMAKKGNEVSMALYGVEMFNEDTYWSISSSDTFLQIAENETTGEFTLKNNGFTKSTVRNASNPIVLKGFEENWCNHVNQMSLYHALTLPLEDFTKVFNYNTGVRTNEDNPTAVTGVRSVIKGAFGNSAECYLRQFISDINGGIREVSRVGIEDNMISLAKKAYVFANLSVVFQQPSAVFRAMSYVNSKFFLPEPNKLVRLQNHHKDWEQLKKYAPIAGIKEMGMFDTGTGKGVLEWLSSGKRDSKVEKAQNFIDDKVSRGPALADEYAWIKLWHAIQRETRAKYGLAIGTEENLVKSGERFNEVIVLTQVYDSVLSRSGAMRSKQTFNKMTTAFMAEPTTVMNMAFDAFVQLKRNGKDGMKQFAKTISVIFTSIFANALLFSLPAAGRDDDEDETYSDKYWQAFWGDINPISWGSSLNPLNYYPFFRDIMSVIDGYTTERMDMSLVSDFVISIKKLMKEDGTTTDNIIDFVGCIANLFGLPVRNVIRDVKAVFNTYDTLTTASKDSIASLEASIPTDYQEAYDKYWRDGYTEDECDKNAQNSVKAKIRKKLKPVYLEALKNQDSATIQDIRRFMRDSGFYKSLNGVDNVLKGWREKSEEEEERAQRAEERK